MSEAHQVCNFPTETEISGFDLAMKMKAHVDSFGTELIMEKVMTVKKNNDLFTVKMINGKALTAKTILIATGTVHRHLDLPDENRFVGHGISYCATCDAMFYKNKTVAVIGSGNSALTAALYLAEMAEKVYLVIRGDHFKGEIVWVDSIQNNPKIEVIFNTSVIGLAGVERLETIKLSQAHNNSDILSVSGLFVEVGSQPDVSWFSNLSPELNPAGYIKVSADQATSQAGVWAAGDITTASNGLRQIVTACAEGAVAAAGIFQYLQKSK